MTNTFQMAANKQALKFLPAGADINALTFTQLRDWAKAMKDATGEAKLGFPAGPRGLMHRFFQGSLYPSYTGGVVRSFANADAQTMWAEFKDLWQYVNPRSTAYGFMEEPLKTGEVWVAFDHTARLLPALNDKPNDFVTFPAPERGQGPRFHAGDRGIAVPKNSPDRAAAERAIDHLTKPATQAAILREVGFFPVVKADLGTLSPGVQLAADGMNKTFAASRRPRLVAAHRSGRQERRVQQGLHRYLPAHRAARRRHQDRARRTRQGPEPTDEGRQRAVLGARRGFGQRALPGAQ